MIRDLLNLGANHALTAHSEAIARTLFAKLVQQEDEAAALTTARVGLSVALRAHQLMLTLIAEEAGPLG